MKFKKFVSLILAFSFILAVSACSDSDITDGDAPDTTDTENGSDTVDIVLSDEEITVDGKAVSKDDTDAVYTANDIVFYLAGQDFTYGEGTSEDEHEQSEADAHTVLHITQPGTYNVTGSLSAGQIAVDLGEDVESDPNAVVTLILNGANITCTVAPAIIFYNVYECGDKDNAVMDVDTASAGANLVIQDCTENTMNGSYVARIYKSVTLSEDGTEVVDSKKLHKYDAAVYSKMSMNVSGEGTLNINAENEGLDSELHLTIHSGNINIDSGNDGINTNEDGISVTTINGGNVSITVNGKTGEGDGIDSNGWLVINGGNVTAAACSTSEDSGIDADNGVYINGGTVIASGNMFDSVKSEQNYAVFSFAEKQVGGCTYTLKDDEGTFFELSPKNDFINLVFSSPDLAAGSYTFWKDDVQLQGASGMNGMAGRPGNMEIPEGMTPPDGESMPEGAAPPDGFSAAPPEGFKGGAPDMAVPYDQEPIDDMSVYSGEQLPAFDGNAGVPADVQPGRPGEASFTLSTVFTITDVGSLFSQIT